MQVEILCGTFSALPVLIPAGDEVHITETLHHATVRVDVAMCVTQDTYTNPIHTRSSR